MNFKYRNEPGEHLTAEILINHSGGTVTVTDAPGPGPGVAVGRAAIVGLGSIKADSQYDIGLGLWNLRFYSRNRAGWP